MNILKDELIKDFLIESGFQIENFEFHEVPFLTGYIMVDNNKNSMLIVRPLFTENLIDIKIDNKSYQYIKRFSNIDKKYHWFIYNGE